MKVVRLLSPVPDTFKKACAEFAEPMPDSRWKILIVANDYIGGVRDHIRSEIRFLRSSSDFYIICNTGEETFVADGFITGVGNYCISPFDDITAVSTKIEVIANFIEENRITTVHCHAYDLLPYAVAAAARTNTKIINTIHGPDVWECAGEHAAGSIFRRFLARIPMHFAVSRCLATELRRLIPGAEVSVLNNPVATIGAIGQPQELRRWAWAGRLSPDKTMGLKPLITALRDSSADSLDIYGNGSAEVDLAKFIEATWPEGVRLCGWQDDVSRSFADYDAVCGMGRVALDAMALGIPTVLVGYDGIKGFVTHGNVEVFSADNFSGRNAQTIRHDEFLHQLAMYDELKGSLDLVEWIGERYDAEKVWGQFLDAMSRATPPTAGARYSAIELSRLALITQRIIRLLTLRSLKK